MRYPTVIATTLGMRIMSVGEGTTTLEIDADAALHSNQQGTAHSTCMEKGESFTSIELKSSIMTLRG